LLVKNRFMMVMRMAWNGRRRRVKKFKFTLVVYFLSLCLWSSFFFHFSFCFPIYFYILILKKIIMSTLTQWEKLIKDIKINMLIVERIKINFWILNFFEKTLKITWMHQKYIFRVFHCFFLYLDFLKNIFWKKDQNWVTTITIFLQHLLYKLL